MEMLWLAEHHFDGICAYVDPVTFAAAIAASTARIHIGFAVAQMSLHHPIRLAEQMALIDNISNGRLLVGLGRGTAYNVYDYQGYGIDPAEAHDRLVEAEQVMVEAWTTDDYRHEGRFWNVRLPALRPRPYTRPHPRLIRACASEEVVVLPFVPVTPPVGAGQRRRTRSGSLTTAGTLLSPARRAATSSASTARRRGSVVG
jgi:alkanesulfonate monooxygenase SsuD/methylene tetrahydromethanopterin reductase-like flavin-dependent oxidoreductase (luciferase family)